MEGYICREEIIDIIHPLFMPSGRSPAHAIVLRKHKPSEVRVDIRELLERRDDADVAVRAHDDDRALLRVDPVPLVPTPTDATIQILVVDENPGRNRSAWYTRHRA